MIVRFISRVMVLSVVACSGCADLAALEPCWAADAGSEPARDSKRAARSKPSNAAAMLSTPAAREAKFKADDSSLDKTHALFSAELEKYVTDGAVDYSAWKKNRGPLENYLEQLSKTDKDDYQHLSDNEKLALWINAYNAFTIKLVLDNYPIKGTKDYYPVNSIRQVDGFWENNSLDLAGRKATLEGIEHDILRRDFAEPRTHFAVVCAAKGCAKLNNAAYTGANIDAELEQAAKNFLGDPKNVKIDTDKKTIHVSHVFKWFPLDFARSVGFGKKFPPPTDDEIVAAYVISRAPEALLKKLTVDDVKQYQVIYQTYDWSLNDSR